MTVEEFLEKFNYAPYEIKEVAELLSTISDNEDVVGTAKAFLESREKLEMQLDDIGFEFG